MSKLFTEKEAQRLCELLWEKMAKHGYVAKGMAISDYLDELEPVTKADYLCPACHWVLDTYPPISKNRSSAMDCAKCPIWPNRHCSVPGNPYSAWVKAAYPDKGKAASKVLEDIKVWGERING